jgi:mannosyltransferase OCH1-like enzyme
MIPKIIHYCWISAEEYPQKIKECMTSWEKHLPGYELRKWDASNFVMDSTKWTSDAIKVNAYAVAADYIRFYALYNYGGIYLD